MTKFAYQFIPLYMGRSGRTHTHTEVTRAFMETEVTLDDLTKMTNTFYNYAFQDATLDNFIRSHNDPHGERFAKWIHQKFTGSTVWDEDCNERRKNYNSNDQTEEIFVHDRTSAHAAAWNSHKRPADEVGQHFTLKDCRVWMRLHFLALRESGLPEKSPTFADYYVRFIGHFVGIYERKAPAFCRESLRWSVDPSNVERYIRNGRRMSDVLDQTFEEALGDLSQNELDDIGVWPYDVDQDERSYQ